MEIMIQSIHFDATEKLKAFINKKATKLGKICDEIRKIDVQLKVVKPETSMNKDVAVTVYIPNGELFAEKVCDTFEEGFDSCVDALLKQLQKYKEKTRNR